MQTVVREPIELAAGDTIAFSRYLPDFLPADGWSIVYVLRGGDQPISFTSTTSGTSHAIAVTAATTATWEPGDYILAGYATKAAERHQIYYGQLTLLVNLPEVDGDEPVKTFAQQMVEMLQAKRLELGANMLKSSSIGETRFDYQDIKDMEWQLGYWLSVRRNEIKMERAKNGLPTGDKIRPIMRITPHGQFWGLPPWFRNGF